jgi:hypothetical protein
MSDNVELRKRIWRAAIVALSIGMAGIVFSAVTSNSLVRTHHPRHLSLPT